MLGVNIGTRLGTIVGKESGTTVDLVLRSSTIRIHGLATTVDPRLLYLKERGKALGIALGTRLRDPFWLRDNPELMSRLDVPFVERFNNALGK